MDGTRSWNWRIWIGFLLTLAVASYVLFFLRFPITRNVPWVTYLLFIVALILLIAGLRKAFGQQPAANRGKVAGPILTVLSVAVMAFFSYGTLYGSRVPGSKEAPKVGEKAPDFSLPDTHGKAFTLAELLASPLSTSAKPPRGVLLVFYRGYW